MSNETFAPVVKWSTIHMLSSFGVMQGWKIASINFKSTFTQSKLPKPIFLELPPGYQHANPNVGNLVVKINISLYGD